MKIRELHCTPRKSLVRILRRRYSLSQKEFGKLCGVSRMTVFRWESDYKPYEPSEATLMGAMIILKAKAKIAADTLEKGSML